MPMIARTAVFAAALAAAPAAAVVTTTYTGSLPSSFGRFATSVTGPGTYLIDVKTTRPGNLYVEFLIEYSYNYICPGRRCGEGQDEFRYASIAPSFDDRLRGLASISMPGFGFRGRVYQINFLTLTLYYDDENPDPVNYVMTTKFVPQVPEPATWAMLIIGFGSVGIATRRRYRTVSGAFARHPAPDALTS